MSALRDFFYIGRSFEWSTLSHLPVVLKGFAKAWLFLIRQRMSRDRTFRTYRNGVDGVFAFGRADGELLVFQIRQQILFCGGVIVGFLLFEGPLLFGGINLAEVIETLSFSGALFTAGQ